MLDQILNSEHNQLFDVVKNFSGVSDDQNEAATTVVKDTIVSSLTQQAQSGDFSGIMEMFSGNQTDLNSPAASGLSSNIVQNLVSKLGISQGNAASLVQQILPVVMNMFNSKASTAQNSGLDIGNLIGQFMGGNQSNSNFDVTSVLSMFTNNSGGGQNNNDGFGVDDLMNIGKKFF